MTIDEINLLKDILETLNLYIAMEDDDGMKRLVTGERDELVTLIERLE